MLARYLRPQSLRVAALSGLLLGSIGLQLANPQILRAFIDAITSRSQGPSLLGIALLFIGVALGQQGLSVAATYVGEVVAWTATNALRWLYVYMRERLRTARRARLISSIPWSVPVLGVALGEGLAFALALALFSGGSVSLGTAFLIYYYTQLLFQPLSLISHQIDDFQKASAGMIRVQELLNTPSALEDGPGAEFPDGPLSVEFRHVEFGYDGDAPVVHDLSFRIEPGEALGLLGRTGSGKTTVTRLLLRLYDPSGGSILLGGVELREARLAELRRKVGMVTQDVQLFRATVRDNITFFDMSVSDDRIMEALDELGLAEWCRALPEGLNTMLGAGGGGLSAGEAQLLAFTRVFLKDPGLVILDEASSRLDPLTERLIERAVDRLLRNRTGIIIAHRLSTLRRTHSILILEDGRIAECGEREALAADYV